jgi:hypothetical protein
MGTRLFSVVEANQLVPVLEASFRRMLQLRSELRTTYAELEKLGYAPTWETLRSPAEVPGHVRSTHGRFLALALAMAEEFEAIVSTGVQVKDPETGLCDFPSLRDDRVVLLCWRLGEPEVTFWHELDSGFAGRHNLEREQTAHGRSTRVA